MANLQPSLHDTSAAQTRAQQLDSVVWATFFIWIGIGMLAAVPWGWFLIGVGALIGVAQVARSQLGLAIDGFWLGCAAVILAAGVWELLRLEWPLAPILLIALGIALLAKTIAAARSL